MHIFGLGLPELIIMVLPVIIIACIVIAVTSKNRKKHEQQNSEASQQHANQTPPQSGSAGNGNVSPQAVQQPDQEHGPETGASPDTDGQAEDGAGTPAAPASIAERLSVGEPRESGVTASAAPAAESMPESVPQEKPNSGKPLLDSWKTSVGFSVLGEVAFFICASLLAVVAAILVQTAFPGMANRNVTYISGPIVGIIFGIAEIIYAAVCYYSYFTDKPRVKSSKAVSFLNLFFGGIIFGACWNHNLTKGGRGISRNVFIALSILGVLVLSWNLFSFVPILTRGTAPSASTTTQSKTNAKTYSFEEDGFSARFTSNPETVSNDANAQIPMTAYMNMLSDNEYEYVEVDHVSITYSEAGYSDEQSFMRAGLVSYMEDLGIKPSDDKIVFKTVQGAPCAYWRAQADDYAVVCETVHDENAIYFVCSVNASISEAHDFVSSFALL